MPSKATIPLQALTLTLVVISCVLNAALGHWAVAAVFLVTAVLNAVLLAMHRRNRESARAEISAAQA